MSSVFETLNVVDVSNRTEKKGKLTYLSWAWAWAEAKKKCPDMNSTVYETESGINYFNDGRTAWVKTGVTINGQEHIEYLPIMDFKNQSIALDKVKSTDVNKAIQRSITKCIGRHGLGLYVYAGEDLPDVPTWPNDKMKDEYVNSFDTCFNHEDYEGMEELWEELKANEDGIQRNKQMTQIWRKLTKEQRAVLNNKKEKETV